MWETLAGLAGAEVIRLIREAVQKGRLDKKIYDIFHATFTEFDNQDQRIGNLCDNRKAFCQEIFSLAQGNIVNVPLLLQETDAYAQDKADPSFGSGEIQARLLDFSRTINNLYRQQVSQELGHMPSGYAFFYWDLGHHRPGGERQEPLVQAARSPLFYVPHRPNPMLRYFQIWMEQISEALATSGQAAINQPGMFRDVALQGQGGLGKTAMAVAYAYEYADKYPGGVFWVQADLGLGQALAELAKGLGWPLPDKATDQQIIQAVLGRLRTPEPKLIILDNQEEKVLPPGIDQVPASHLLVTTRLTDVNLGGQVSMALPAEEEALGIFLAYAKLEGKELSKRQKEAAYAICQRVGLLPLALEILGKNARKTPLPDLAGALDQAVIKKSTVLTKGQELTIAAALAVTSQKYVHPRAGKALLYLAYLYPEELDQEILGKVMEVEPDQARAMLESLAEFSVVQPKPDGGYTMHRLVQEAARLEDEGREVGERVVAILSDQIQKICKKGIYKKGYQLIPHLISITRISDFCQNNNSLPGNRDLIDWAFFIWESGRFLEAENLILLVKSRADSSEVPDGLLSAQMTINISLLKRDQGSYSEALSLIRGALPIIEKIKGKETTEYAVCLNNYAEILAANNQIELAEAVFRQALEIDKKTVGLENVQYGTHCGNLAGALEKQEKYKEAEELRRISLDIHRKHFPEDHPYIATGLNNLGMVLEKQTKFAEAEKAYRQAIKIDEKTTGKNNFKHGMLCGNLASALEGQNKLSEAERLRRLALKIHLDTFSMNNYLTATSLNNLAQLLVKRSNIKEAIDLYRQAMEITDRLYGKDRIDYAIQSNNLGKAYQALGKFTEAEKLYRQAIDICLRILGTGHQTTLTIKKNLDTLLAELKSRS